MIKIKPCPFCGGEASTFERELMGRRVEYDVRCPTNGCYLEFGADWYFESPSVAIEKWNSREKAAIGHGLS